MAELRAFLLTAFLSVVWGREPTPDNYPDSVAVERPLPSTLSMVSCVTPSVTVRFYEITIKGSDSDAVYRRISVSIESLKFGSNGTTDFSATDTYKCARAVAADGLEAFSYNGSCTGYRLHTPFLNCATGEFVLYVRTDHLDDKLSVVPIDEAPKKLMDDGRGPYWMYMGQELILIENGPFVFASPTKLVLANYITAAYENGDFSIFFQYYLDPGKCFTDNANGVPLSMDIKTEGEKSDTQMMSAYFLNECGNTLQVTAPNSTDYVMYSHAGLGCTHYPADAPDECTVTLDIMTSMLVSIYALKTDSNSKCGGLDLDLKAWSTTSMETETPQSCDDYGIYRLNQRQIFDKVTISISRRMTPVLGFVLITN